MGADFSKIVDDVQHCNCYGGVAPEEAASEERVEQESLSELQKESAEVEDSAASSSVLPSQDVQVAPPLATFNETSPESKAKAQSSGEAEAARTRSSQELATQKSVGRIDSIRRALSGQVASMSGKVMPGLSKKESTGQLSAQSSERGSSTRALPVEVAGPIDIDTILADPEGAGRALYPRVFVDLAGDSATLELDSKELRDFVLKHSGVSEDDLDTEILKAASCREDFKIDAASFTKLLQEQPLAEAHALNIFLGMSGDGETITAEDCRSCLLRVLEQLPDVKGRSEEIFDTVMAPAGLAVPMDQWMSFATKTARVARLMQFVEHSDGHSREQPSTKVEQQPSVGTRRSAARVGGA